MEAQAFNTVIAYENKKRSGAPTTPTEDMAANLARQRLTKAVRYTDPTGTMYEQPGMDLSAFSGAAPAPAAPSAGTVEPAPAPVPSPERVELGKKPRKYSEFELASAGYADRMTKAGGIMEGLTTGGFEPGQMGHRVAQSLPFGVGNYALPPEAQKYKQAQEDWVRAKLRKESGAVIGPQEMIDEIKTYFPQPGDGPEVIEQKIQSRKTATEGMVRVSQGSFTPPEATAGERPQGLDDAQWSRLQELRKKHGR